MPQDDDDMPGLFRFGPIPPEVSAAIQAQRDKHAMMVEDFQKALDRLLTETPTEHLVTFNQLLVQINRSMEPAQYGNYLEGTFTTVLRQVRKVCSNCGEAHDDMELVMAAEPAEEPHRIGAHEEESE